MLIKTLKTRAILNAVTISKLELRVNYKLRHWRDYKLGHFSESNLATSVQMKNVYILKFNVTLYTKRLAEVSHTGC